MNRKDLIVVGVVANVALTLALFLSAGRPSRSVEDLVASIPRGVETIAPSIQPPALTLKPLAQKVAEEQREKPVAAEPPKALPRLVQSPAPEKVEIKQVALSEEKPIMQQVVVRSGDVLEKIARQYHSSVEEIRRVNHLNDDRLQIGQLLQVPLLAKSKKMEAKPIDPNGKYYTVRPGESPWIIAAKHQMKVEELLRLNQLDEDKAKKIKAGDTLRIA